MPRNRLILFIIVLVLALSGVMVSQAQDNLLSDPGFEGDYSGQGRGDFNFPTGWSGWYTNSPSSEDWMNVDPIAYPHTGGFKRSGNKSLNISRGWGTFTAAASQQIQGIPAGTVLQASVWAFLENVSESNAQVRIGIGNNVGNNPTAAGITWSPWMKTVQSWQQVSVQATAAGGSVTVFIYATQTWPNNPNGLYLDDASLVAIGTGEVPSNDDGGGDGDSGDGGGDQAPAPAPTTAPPVDVVPFASAQGERDDGSIVHVVVSGDTINSIAVAYGVPANQILQLNNLANARLIQPGQELLIKEADPVQEEDTSETGTDDGAETSDTAEDADPGVTEVAQEPTAEPTDPPTEAPTEIPTETLTPTITPIPATPTDAPPAPVVDENSVFPAIDPLSTGINVCVSMFDDANRNTVQEEGEDLLAGGRIIINTLDGQRVAGYETGTQTEPYCFDELEPGSYRMVISSPTGYGLTTSSLLDIQVQTGSQLSLSFGAAEGLEVAAAPTSDSSTISIEPQTNTTPDTATKSDPLNDNLGLILIGAAGVVLLGGLGVSLLLRRS